jgi:hypothetical protein
MKNAIERLGINMIKNAIILCSIIFGFLCIALDPANALSQLKKCNPPPSININLGEFKFKIPSKLKPIINYVRLDKDRFKYPGAPCYHDIDDEVLAKGWGIRFRRSEVLPNKSLPKQPISLGINISPGAKAGDNYDRVLEFGFLTKNDIDTNVEFQTIKRSETEFYYILNDFPTPSGKPFVIKCTTKILKNAFGNEIGRYCDSLYALNEQIIVRFRYTNGGLTETDIRHISLFLYEKLQSFLIN